MPLIGSDTLMGMIRGYRVLNIDGRFGGGKTSLAHIIYKELKEAGFVDYLVSNVKSIWRDDPEKIKLVGGKLANACVILDEAGLYLEYGADAKKFLAYLRKMNIVLIMPSVLPPSSKVTFLTAQRTMTFNSVGIPLWMYKLRLKYGSVKSDVNFYWWRPSEIFGVYDTSGAPDDDGGLDYYVAKWSKELQENTGYGLEARQKRAARRVEELSGEVVPNTVSVGQELAELQLRQMEAARRASESFAESASQISEALSVSRSDISRKGRN